MGWETPGPWWPLRLAERTLPYPRTWISHALTSFSLDESHLGGRPPKERQSEEISSEELIPESQIRRKQNRSQQKQRRLRNAMRTYDENANMHQYPKYYSLQFPRMNIEKDIDVVNVEKDLREKIGDPEQIKKQNRETLLIKVKSRSQGQQLSNVKKIATYDVNVSEHNSLNQSKGTVYSEAMSQSSIDTLEEALRSQKVIKVERMKKRENGVLVDTHRYIITFAMPELPESIKLATWHFELIDRYIPKPMRCNNCQRLGHTAKKCHRKETICAKCGQEGHMFRACNNEAKCVLCGGPHPSTYNKCPSYVFKSEVLATQVKCRLTFKEAEDDVKKRYRDEGKNYSFIVKQQRIPSSQQSQHPSQREEEDEDRRRGRLQEEEEARRLQEEEEERRRRLQEEEEDDETRRSQEEDAERRRRRLEEEEARRLPRRRR